MSSTAIINTRKELKEVLQKRMANSYKSVKQDQRLDDGQTYLKSYLIESDRSDFSTSILDTNSYNVKTRETAEDGFLNIQVKNGSDGTSDFYLDKMDDRFWTIHTLASSDISDRFIEKIVFPRYTKLDFPWLSNKFLKNIGNRNDFRSFSLKFEDEFGQVGESDEESTFGMSMRLWGGTAKTVLNTLTEDDTLGPSTSLSNIGIRREITDEETLLEDITNQGKFTARGDSVDGHFHQLNKIKQEYNKILEIIEEEYSISRHSSGAVTGSPLTIEFEREVTDFEEFFETILSSKKPFRIWGVQNQIGEDYHRVSAVDLHTGDEVNLEMSPHWIRIYLPEGCCGNVVLRIYAVIQHYFDSRAKLKGIDNGVII